MESIYHRSCHCAQEKIEKPLILCYQLAPVMASKTSKWSLASQPRAQTHTKLVPRHRRFMFGLLLSPIMLSGISQTMLMFPGNNEMHFIISYMNAITFIYRFWTRWDITLHPMHQTRIYNRYIIKSWDLF